MTDAGDLREEWMDHSCVEDATGMGFVGGKVKVATPIASLKGDGPRADTRV
jgi:hypothetical protein